MTPPEEARAAEVREWLPKAHEDLRSARVLTTTGQCATALFHCQQCAEKSPKAFLTWHERPFRKTHDLQTIGADCTDLDGSLQDLMTEA